MNFVGTFDAKLPVDGPGAHPTAQLHVDSVTTHVPADAVVVPDAHLLFTGDFKRSGVDLILSKGDHELVLQDYFKGEKRAPLASPDGAHLSGDLVNTLAGHVDYAQADGGASAATVIGHVSKLVGSATAIRNGVSIILNQGDNVDKGDVVQSGSDSTLGITFIDGTVFGLSSNAKMVLNEMVYDPNGSSNSSLLSLVAGTISFVAGETAKHGDMKIDTPVATMGIRGTAVLVEIDFNVPQGDAPDAKFQVLVEPDGTTGSYILFDKQTLDPIATVNQAGTQTVISHGVVSFLNTAPISPDVQKLITEVFTEKFTDNTNVNTKNFDHYTDTLLPQTFTPFILVDHATAVPVFVNVPAAAGPPPTTSNGPPLAVQHINQAPTVVAFGGAITEIPGVTHSAATDTVSGKINFVDVNAGDFPTAKTSFTSFTYQNAQHTDVTSTLSALQQKDIALVEAALVVVAAPGNNNNGTATWTYSVADGLFDFLAAGEKLTLTYTAEVDSNYAPDNLATLSTFTITITGTNDAPVITTGPQTIAFSGGINTPGGDLTSNMPTQGTLAFTDVDLTDTHTVSTKLTAMSLSGAAVPPAPLAIFENALTASVATDSTGSGNGTIDWKLAELPVYLADFIPNGQTLTLTYTVTLTDSQGAPTTQNVIVNITGTGTPAVVWIATTSGPSPGGSWSDASNWETGTVPTATDDAIIITDQLIGLTPSYPVTIGAPAFAKSLTMNDFGTLFTNQPTLINQSSLTVGAGGIALDADAVVDNGSLTDASAAITVAGLMEVLDQSSVQNYGRITLQGGGDFKNLSTITNFSSGTIEVAGGTLNVQVDIANSGAVTIDPHATLTLNGGAIDGGIVANRADGILNLIGGAVLKNGSLDDSAQMNVSGSGNALDNETVSVSDALALLPGGTLTVDQGSVVTNSGIIGIQGGAPGVGELTVNDATIKGGSIVSSGAIKLTGAGVLENGSLQNSDYILVSGLGNALHNETVTVGGSLEILPGGALTIDQGSTVTYPYSLEVDAGTLTLNDATINTGVVYNDPGGIIDLSGSAVLKNGWLYNVGQLNVSGTGNALHDENLSHNAALEVLAGGALTIDQGTIVTNSGGTVTVDGTAVLTLNTASITGGSLSNSGTLNSIGTSSLGDVGITNSGLIESTGGTLTIDPTVAVTLVNSGTLEANGGELDISEAVTNNATLQAIDSSTLKLVSTTVTDNTGGTVTVGFGSTLDLVGANIDGGTLTNSGTLDSTGTSSLSNVGITNSGLIESTGGTLTIDPVAVVTLVNSGTLEANGGELDISEAVTNNATLQAIDDSTLKLISTTVTDNTGGTVTVGFGSTLDLVGANIDGGTLTESGTLDSTGTSSLSNVGITNSGLIESTGGTLTIDPTVAVTLVNSGTLEANGGELDISEAVTNNASLQAIDDSTLKLISTTVTDNTGGTVTVGPGSTLDLVGANIDGGTLTNNGTLDSTGSSSLSNVGISNTGLIESTGGTLTIDPIAVVTLVNSGTLEANGGELDISEAVTNNATLQAIDSSTLKLISTTVTDNTGGTVTVGPGSTLDLVGANIDGGTLTNNGTLDSTGTSSLSNVGISNTGLIESTGGTLTIDPTVAVTLVNSGTLEANGGELDISEAVTNNASLQAIDDSTLKLISTTVTDNTGGTVTVGLGSTLDLVGANVDGGTLGNAGQINVSGTGNALHDVKLTNTGAIEIFSLGTLTLDQLTAVTNGGHTMTVDGAATLTLNDASIDGGTINDYSAAGAGSIAITGSSKISNAGLNHGTVSLSDAVVLTLDGDTVTGTSFSNTASGATIQVDDGDTLTLSDVTVSGLTVNDGTSAGATIDITASSKISDGALNHGTVSLSGGVILTLDGDTVTGTSFSNVSSGAIIQVDDGDTLTLSGVTVSGVTVNDGATIAGATIDVTASSKISTADIDLGKVVLSGGVILTLDNDTVTGTSFSDTSSGAIIQVDGNDTLTLSGVTMSGVTINDGTAGTGATIDVAGLTTISNGALNHGAVAITGGVILTLDNDTVTGTSFSDTSIGAIIQVDGGDTLTLSGVTMSGVTINDGTAGTGATIDVTGLTTISNGALNHGVVAISGGVTLTLDGDTVTGTSFSDTSSGAIIQVDGNDTLTLSGVTISDLTINDGTASSGATIDVTGLTTISDGALNHGAVAISGGVTLTLDGDTVTGSSFSDTSSGAIIQVDGNDTLTLSGVTISDLTINDGTASSGATIDVSGLTTISNGALNHGAVAITGGVTLTLDGDTVTGSSFSDTSSGAIIQVDGNDTLTLSGVTISDLTINDGTASSGATIDVSGLTTISNGALNHGAVAITGGVMLTLDYDTATGTSFSDTSIGAIIQVDGGDTLTLSGVTMSGVTINDGTAGTGATIDVTGLTTISNGALNHGAVAISGGVMLTLDDDTVTGTSFSDTSSGAIIQVDGNDTLTLSGVTISDLTINDGTASSGATIDVSGLTTISNGALNHGAVAISGGVTLTLDNDTVIGTSFSDTSSGAIIQVDGNDTLTLSGVTIDSIIVNDGTAGTGATIDVTGLTTISNGALNHVAVAISGGVTLTLDNDTATGTSFSDTSSGAIIQVDAGDTLTLSGVTVSGVTINDGTAGTGATIDVTGLTTISNGALNHGVVAISGGVTLTLDNDTVTGTSFSDTSSGAIIQVDGNDTLTLSGVTIDSIIVNDGTAGTGATIDVTGLTTISNGALNHGAVAISGGVMLTLLDDDTVTGTSFSDTSSGATIQVDDGDTLTLSGVTIGGVNINDGDTVTGATIDVTASSKISGADIGFGKVVLSGGVILTLDGDTVTGTSFSSTSSGAIIQVDGGDTLTLSGGMIDGVTVANGSASSGAAIDVTASSKISNAALDYGTVSLSGGVELTLDNDTVTGTSFSNTSSGATIQVDDGDTLTLSDVTIDGIALSNAGAIDNASGSNSVSAAVTNTGTIEVEAGTLDLAGGLSGAGSLLIDAGATLELAGADAQSVTFSGGLSTLQLDNALGFTGTITAVSSAGGTFTITGPGSITTTSGDAIDFTASGGTPSHPADVTLTPAGAVTGAVNGIDVVQNGVGDLTIEPAGKVVGLAGGGIIAEIGATGSGNIVVDDSVSVTGTGSGSVGVLAENLNTADSGNVTVTQLGGAIGGEDAINAFTEGNGNVGVEAAGTLTATADQGIQAVSYGTGDISVTTDAGSAINSGGSGILVVNLDSAIAASADSTVTVTVHGTINSGTAANPDGAVASGITAGYYGTPNVVEGGEPVANTDVNGTVVVDNYATITALAGYGIEAYNYGNGDVTVNDKTGTSVTGAQYGVGAYGLSGGTGDVAVHVGENATITGTSDYGIDAVNLGVGNVCVSTAAGDTITSGSAGIVAVNEATAVPSSAASSIVVTAYGTIDSGNAIVSSGNPPAGILAGYLGGSVTPSNSPLTDVNGDVTVNNYADINAAAGDGIRAYNYGIGDVTVNDDSGTVTALGGTDPTKGFGNGIAAYNFGTGDINVTTAAGVVIDSGASGIDVNDADAAAPSDSEVYVLAHGTITSGTIETSDGSPAAGILAGYNYNSAADNNAHGNVVIDDYASITAAAGTDGIRGYNYGTGTVTITAETGAVITAGRDGIDAVGKDGGDVSVTNYATVSAATAIQATTDGTGTATIDNHGTITGAVTSYNATFTNESGAVWNLTGNSVFTGTSSIENIGTIDTTLAGSGKLGNGNGDVTLTNDSSGVIDATHGTLTLDTGSTIGNAGLIEATGSGTLHLDDSVSNSGTLEANGGTLVIGPNVSVSGDASVTIAGGGLADFAGNSAQGQPQTLMLNASFYGSGTLQLDDSQHYGGTVSGFGAGDIIDLADVTYSPNETDVWNGLTDTLTITSGTHSSSITFSGSYGQNSFALTSDAHGNTEVVVSPTQAALTDLDNAGNAVEGTAVAVSLTDASAQAVSYQWFDNGAPIAGATQASYAPVAGDIGHPLDVVVGYTEGGVAEQITAVAGIAAAAPEVSFGSSAVSTDENAPLALSPLSVTFADAGSDIFTVTLDAGHGTLSLGDATGVSNNGTAAVTLSGTLSAIDTALAGVTYTPEAGFVGADTVSLAASDGAFTATPATLNVDVLGPVATSFTINNAAAPASSGWAYDPENGHYYKYVAASLDDWTDAMAAAAADNGAYLATITSGAENVFVSQLLANGATAWTGGETTQDPPNGQQGNSAPFYWHNGPEAGTLFSYTSWNNDAQPPGGGEPTGGFGTSVESLQVGSNGEWNDVPSDWQDAGYVEEVGGLAGQIAFTENTTTDIAASVVLANDTDTTGGTLTITNITAGHGTVTLNDGIISYNPDLDYSGADSFSYTISDGTFSSTGTVDFTVAAAPTLLWNTSSGDWITSTANWSAGAAPVAADDVTINTPYTVTISDAEIASAQTLTLDNAASALVDAGTLTLTGGLAVEAGAFQLQGGSLQALSITVAAAAGFSGYGTVTGPIAVAGTLEAAGGNLDFTGYVTGNGTFNIAAGATLEFDGAVSTGTVASFEAGTGTLAIAQSTAFQGEVAGISAVDDVLDLGGLLNSNGTVATQTGDAFQTSASYNSANGTTLLTVTDATQGVSTFVTLVGDYSNTVWAASSDSHGGVDVAEAPPPVFDSMTLTVSEGGTTVLSDADFNISDSATSHFTYTVSDLSGGQFEVFNTANSTWTASTSFTTAQVEASQVEFAQDGSTTAPNFSIFASDGVDHSATITPTVDFIEPHALAPANLIVNGGFETGDVTGWTLGGDTSSDVPAAVAGPNPLAPNDAPHTGVHYALFTGLPDEQTMSQTVATTDGQHYTVDFWVMQDQPISNVGNDFSVSWNGTALTSLTDVGQQSNYTEYQFDVTGTAGSSTLEFSGSNGSGFWDVDDVSVLQGAPNTVQQMSDETTALTGVNATDTLTVAPTTQNALGTVSATAGNGAAEWQFAATDAQLDHLMGMTQSYTVTDANNPAVSQTLAVSIGGNGNDQFVFNPGVGADTMVNFSTLSTSTGYAGDTIELEHFASIASVSDVLAHLGADSHGNAVVDLGNHDSITFQGMSVAALQANAAHMFQIVA